MQWQKLIGSHSNQMEDKITKELDHAGVEFGAIWLVKSSNSERNGTGSLA